MTRMLAAVVSLVFSLAVAGVALAHPPRGLVVDPAGRVWFSDLKTVWMIDEQGRLSSARAGADRHTHELGIDTAGNVYGEDSYYDPATATYQAAVWRLTRKGRFAYLQPPTSSPPIGLSVWRDAAGRTYLAGEASRGSSETLLFRRDPNGRVARLLGNAGRRPGSRRCCRRTSAAPRSARTAPSTSAMGRCCVGRAPTDA